MLLGLAGRALGLGGVPFVVRVTDDATGRGVPLVELTTLDQVAFVTDSAGVVAIDDPALLGRRVFFHVTSPGYEVRQRVFGEVGAVLEVRPGGSAELSIHRQDIAERLYRVTGEGIYRDSVLAGRPVPIARPLENGGVLGQDTVTTALYHGRIYWIWGDTTGFARYNFGASGATSELPGRGGLDPALGIDLHYFTGEEGFSRPMLPLSEPGLVWIEGLFTVRDPSGTERLLATYTRQAGLTPPLECGVALFDDSRNVFVPWRRRPCAGSHRSSHPFRLSVGGRDYWYLYPHLRVPDDWAAIGDPARWESYVRTAEGRWAWRPGEVRSDPAATGLFPLADARTGKATGAYPSCVTWNAFRRRWILLAERVGDVYYAEADRPEGPWREAVRVVHHEHYNFYNVASHPFFDQQDGRIIYFEGTYTATFSDARHQTPRYDYNQVMYRLRLDDPRLALAH